MEFILIPLFLFLSSGGGVLFIVWRKMPHLEKLAETEGQSGTTINWSNMAHDLCPEIWDWVSGVRIEERAKEYKKLWFVEMEKFLRRLRVVSLKMDRLSGLLIKKIRSKTYSNGDLTYVSNDENKNGQAKSNLETEKSEKEEFKKTEQKLILEIAKNPKSTVLYEELGDLYFKGREYKDAKESYEAAIELNPQNESLKQKLSSTLEKLNKPETSQN